MQIIQIEPYANGARPALQEWSGAHLPEGYAMIAEEFAEVFYSTRPAGFVHITVEEDEVIACTVNQEALDAYTAAHPNVTPEETEPTAEELIDIMLGVNRYE